MAVGDSAVKVGLEGRDQGDSRQFLAQQPHRLDVGRIVGRGHGVDLLHRREHLGRDALHAADGAAVDRLEGDRRNFRRVFQAARLGIGQLRKAKTDGLGMVGHAERLLLPPVADLHRAAALRRTDPFDAARASCRRRPCRTAGT